MYFAVDGNDFAVVKFILPWMKMILRILKIDFAVAKLILP